jgi:hypothetical protein
MGLLRLWVDVEAPGLAAEVVEQEAVLNRYAVIGDRGREAWE